MDHNHDPIATEKLARQHARTERFMKAPNGNSFAGLFLYVLTITDCYIVRLRLHSRVQRLGGHQPGIRITASDGHHPDVHGPNGVQQGRMTVTRLSERGPW